MKTTVPISAWRLGLMSILLAAGTLAAAEQVSSNKRATFALPLSRITSIDYTNMTFTVARNDTNLVLWITSNTRFFKAGKYVTTRDFAIGDEVQGTTTPGEEGRVELLRLRSGKGR